MIKKKATLNPEVFIGMPVFNAEKTIESSIQSLLNQTYSNFRLFISDNNSTDNTIKIIKKFAAKDSRITIKSQKTNIGAQLNFFYCLEKSESANTRFFMWAACDDFWHKDFLYKCVRTLCNKTEYCMAFSRYSVKSYRFPFLKIANLPDLSFLNSSKNIERIKKFILLDCKTHKANAIYGLWRQKYLFKYYQKLRQKNSEVLKYPLDISLLIFVLAKGRVIQIKEKLFTKMYWGFPPGHWFIKNVFFIRNIIRVISNRQSVTKVLSDGLENHLKALRIGLEEAGIAKNEIDNILLEKRKVAILE